LREDFVEDFVEDSVEYFAGKTPGSPLVLGRESIGLR
jgi:hypothetical protein